MDLLAKREVSEKEVALELDKFRKAGKNLRDAVGALAADYEFLERERFVNGLSALVDKLVRGPLLDGQQGNVEKFPDSVFLVRFLVSIFRIYKFTKHQDLTMHCAEFCLEKTQPVGKSGWDAGMASAYSTMLSKVVDNAVVAGASEKMRRRALQKTVELAGAFGETTSTLRAFSEVSTFAYRIRSIDAEQKPARDAELPLPDRDPYFTFLLAMGNAMLVSDNNPGTVGGFLESAMDMQRSCRDDLFFSAAAIISWASVLELRENREIVQETLLALRDWDKAYLVALEANLLQIPGLLEKAKNFNPPE